ncbi:MAG: 50S ribosomal protein L9 [Prochloraceae cyanobacterium]|nr:50S ribosomal protein L9 [Prochloraceae cyanobacterium]
MPKQKVQILLNKGVTKLGKRGDLVEVAPGYARNFLIPQGIATVATPGIIRQVEQRRAKEQEQILAIRQEAESRKTALQTVGRFTIRKQVGEKDAIFGTVTTQEVADLVKANAGLDIDKRGITLPEISKTGFYQAEIKLHPEVSATIEIQVAPL